MNKVTDVIIIGAGPTGLTAAIEAARRGLSVRIVDKNESRSPFSKALVAHARTLEIFQDMGLIDPVLASGKIFRALNIYDQTKQMAQIVFEDLEWKDALYPYWLSIPQSDTERCLEERLAQLGVHVERKTELSKIDQSPEMVTLTLTNPDGDMEIAHTSWVIGCDGARSTTRKLANLDFEGKTGDAFFILADVGIETTLPDDEGYNVLSSGGVVLIVPLPGTRYRRLIFHMPKLKSGEDFKITLASLQMLLDERTKLPIRLTEIGWTSHFSVKHFVASKHRQGRIFLAGDAAHIHSPVGGQGMNSGIQDAYNLMWKLALVHHGQAKPLLLNSYESERHQVAENLIKRVSIATQIITISHPITQSLRNRLGNVLINTRAVRNQLGRNVAMLDIHYHQSPVVYEDAPLKLPVSTVINYSGKNSPKPGYRAPNVRFQKKVQDAEGSLWDHFSGNHHTLLMFMGQDEPAILNDIISIADQIKNKYMAPIRPLIIANKDHTPDESSPFVLVDTRNIIHQAYRAQRSCLYIIRPDQYIAYRNQTQDLDTLIEYLDRILNPFQSTAKSQNAS